VEIIRKVVIDYYNLLFTVDNQPHSITSCRICLLGNEYAVYSLALLCQRTDARQEVAVSANTLLNIIRTDLVINHKALIAVNFLRPFPYE
jgi:hypothetical protein